MKSKFINLNRLYKQIMMILADQIVLLFSLWLAFVLRFGDVGDSVDYMYSSWWLFLLIPLVTTLFFVKFGLYRAILKYIGVRLILTTFRATTISYLLIVLFLFFYDPHHFPRSILLTFWFVSNVLLIISRFLLKGVLYSWDTFQIDKKNILIYGAGRAGVQITESIKKTNEYNVVGFIDDDLSKVSTIVNSIEVFGFGKLHDIIIQKKVKSLILAIPSAKQNQRQDILKKLSRYPLEVKSLPNLDDIENDLITLDQIKFVEVDDILGREVVLPKKELLEKNIQNGNILITGAGGSIGSELSRQIKDLKPSLIVLLDNSEYNLYNIHHELTINNGVEVIPVLSTVTNYNQVYNVIKKYKIDTIYHAAAYKHVPMVELNVVSGVYNNVIGTYNIAFASKELAVKNLILISTDKAVRPTNVMGASKRLSEFVLQAFAHEESDTCFSMVRFGNVIDSAGSVVPLFRSQIKQGGPVTVTHRNITRYFMSIPEAVQLVLQSGSMAKGGDVFVLDMGDPIKILDLAYRMIHLSGLIPIDNNNPDGDIQIQFTGLRPGEKLYEELLIGDDVIQSKHPRILQAREEKLSMNKVLLFIELIKKSRDLQDEKIIKDVLLKYVKGYTLEFEYKK
jgi:FlaA1/EpsC-like NDP-sugar epimerase